MNTNMDNLNPAYTVRSQARAKLDQDTQAVERAMRLDAEAQSRLSKLESAGKSSIDRRARELAGTLSGGALSASLQEGGDEGAEALLTSARIQGAITASALALVKGDRVKSQAALQTAEAAVVACVDAIFAEEVLEQERLLTHHLDEALKIAKALSFAAIADEVNGRRQQPAKVTETLARLDVPLLDRRDVGTNFLRFGDQDAAARRNARRAAMIAAEEIKTE